MLAALISLVTACDSGQSLKVAVARDESLHVERSGRGEPLVLVPGFFGSTYGFRKLVPLLEQAGYQPTIIEPLGTGFSSRPPHADYSFLAQADRIAAVLDTLGLRHVLVIAHSVGGATLFRVAYRRPDLVAGLVSLEGGPTEKVATDEFKRAAEFVPWMKLLGGLSIMRRVVRHTLSDASGDKSWVTDSVVAGYTAGAAADIDGTLKSYLAMAAAKEHDRLEPHLKEIRFPVRLVLGGVKHDGRVEPQEIAELQRSLPVFALDTIPGAGHYLQEERPQAILPILAKVRASAGLPQLPR